MAITTRYDGSVESGTVAIFSGRDYSEIRAHTAGDGGDTSGLSIANIKGVNNDGFADVVISCPSQRKIQVVIGNGDWDRGGLPAINAPRVIDTKRC